jgi:glycyl-tRNA synthetase beta chain
MNKEFLLELYSGEIPARFQESAAVWLKSEIDKQLTEQGFKGFISSINYSARRISLLIEQLENFSPEQVLELRGPKIDANASALEGFVRGNNISKEQLVIKNYKGVDHYFLFSSIQKQPTIELLKHITEKVLNNFYWPKSMKWDETGIKWVRPLLNILAIYDQKIVDIRFGDLVANNLTYGHTFYSKKAVEIFDFDSYKKALSNNYVMFNQDERISFIEQGAKKIAEKANLDLLVDNELLREVSALVEWPNLLIGDIEQKFLELPQEILISSIRTHQKYICMLNPKGGLADKFIVVANTKIENNETVIKGNERVLKARLNDAMFYFYEDQKVTLAERTTKLSKIVFHNKLGTLLDKVRRVEIIASLVSEELSYGLDREDILTAANLMKSDLTTDIVGEFPELQGVMGYYYAQIQGYSDDIARAIKEHYQPLSRSDDCPSSPLSIVIACADKIDSLMGLFYAGEKPTGSKDQFAVRRIALGVIRILLENKIFIDITKLLSFACISFSDVNKVNIESAVVDEVKAFIIERFFNLMKSDNYDYQIIECVVNNLNDVYLAKQKLIIITQNFTSKKSSFSALSRVLKFKVNLTDEKEVRVDLFQDLIESEIYNAVQKISQFENSKMEDYLEQLLEMDELINSYMDKVIINHTDESIKNNRHKTLKLLQQKILDFANLSFI